MINNVILNNTYTMDDDSNTYLKPITYLRNAIFYNI